MRHVLYLDIFIFIWDWRKSGTVIYLQLCLWSWFLLCSISLIPLPLINMTASWLRTITIVFPDILHIVTLLNSPQTNSRVFLEKKKKIIVFQSWLKSPVCSADKINIPILISVCSDAACGSPRCFWGLYLHCREHTWKIGKGDANIF